MGGLSSHRTMAESRGRTERELISEPIPNSAMWKIKWKNGGEVPKVLHGAFTSKHEIQKQINNYLSLPKHGVRRRRKAS